MSTVKSTSRGLSRVLVSLGLAAVTTTLVLLGGAQLPSIALGAVSIFSLGIAGTYVSTRGATLREAVASGLLMPWLGLVFSLTYGLSTLAWLGAPQGSAALISRTSIVPALVIAAVGFGSLLISYAYSVRSGIGLARSLRSLVVGPPTTFGLPAVWILYLVGLAATIAQIRGGSFGYLSNVSRDSTTASGLALVTTLLSGFTLYALALVTWGAQQHRLWRWWLSLIVIVSAQMALGVLAGMKEQLIMAAVASALGYSFAKRVTPSVRIGLALGLTLLIAVPVITAYRQVVAVDGHRLTPGEVLSNISRTTGNAKDGGSSIQSAFQAFLWREARVSDLAIIYQKTPDTIPYRSVTELAEAPAVALVPRALWPEKPIRITGLDFSRDYYNLPDTVYSASAVTPYGDLYRHGGWTVLIVGGLVYGWLVGLFDKAAQIGRRDPRWLFLTIGAFVVIVKQESDFGGILASLPGIILFAALASRVVGLFGSRATDAADLAHSASRRPNTVPSARHSERQTA